MHFRLLFGLLKPQTSITCAYACAHHLPFWAKRTFPAKTLGSFPFLDDHCHHDMPTSLCKQNSWVAQTEKLVQGGSLMTHFDTVIHFSGIGP